MRSPYLHKKSDRPPFGFQGSYSDVTGFNYLINRYYDPSTDQFLSIDIEITETDQPYVFTNDDPMNVKIRLVS
jgi:RHS repeat-associated protein